MFRMWLYKIVQIMPETGDKMNDRKQRMESIKGKMSGMGEEIDFEWLISWIMMAYGISRRDARDEVKAVAKLEGIDFKC